MLQPSNNSKVAPLEKKRAEKFEISGKIQSELASLDIKLNSTLKKVIKSAPEETVLIAIEALKQAITAGNIERPGGWLKRAIEECWQPNESLQKIENKQHIIFNQWFELARAKGLVVASMKGDDDQQYVFDREGVRYHFEQMLAKYPLESLKS